MDPHLTHDSLGPPEPITQTASRSVHSFVHSSLTAECSYTLQWASLPPSQNCPFPWEHPDHHLIHGSVKLKQLGKCLVKKSSSSEVIVRTRRHIGTHARTHARTHAHEHTLDRLLCLRELSLISCAAFPLASSRFNSWW